jgi:hypothetical protein
MRERGARWPADQITDVVALETHTLKKIVRLKILYRPTDSLRAETSAKDPECILVMVRGDGDAEPSGSCAQIEAANPGEQADRVARRPWHYRLPRGR